MDTGQRTQDCLERLGEALRCQGFTAQVTARGAAPCLQVANAQSPELNERVCARPDGSGRWMFWWPWDQPIGPADDLDTVTGKIATVLRSVQGQP
jgi:hypothetical protein